MFKKYPYIAFKVDKESNLQIDLHWQINDEQSINQMATLVAMIQNGLLINNVGVAIVEYGKQNGAEMDSTRILRAVESNTSQLEQRSEEKYLEKRIINKRDPMIPPDAVLSIFKNSINT
jgi:hypothetical protein